MRNRLKTIALAAALITGIAGMAFAQNMTSGDETWAEPGHWQWGQFGYAPVQGGSAEQGAPMYGGYYGYGTYQQPYYGSYGYYGYRR